MDTSEMYTDVIDPTVRTLLQHMTEKPIEHYIKQCIDNRLINPKQDKDVEDVIRLYWSIQDTEKYTHFRVNPIYQRIRTVLQKYPTILDKLYRCRKDFARQQIKYTESVRAIVKFGKYSMFSTEYDEDILVPGLSSTLSWGTTYGVTAKQIALAVAHPDTTFIQSMVSPEDIRYAKGLATLFASVSISSKMTLVDATEGRLPDMVLFGDYAFVEGISHSTNTRMDEHKQKKDDTYNVLFGNPFLPDVQNTVSIPDPSVPSWRNESITVSDPLNTYTGIISKYGLIDVHTLDIERYREYLDIYLKSPYFKEENPQLFSYIWSRFEPMYDKLLRALVDRAILYIHQYMVDFLISIMEENYTIPQLCVLYAPGNMIIARTDFEINQSSMVLYPAVENGNDGLALRLKVLNPNVTRVPNIMVQDDRDKLTVNLHRSKHAYSLGLLQTANRGSTAFKYFAANNNVSLMMDSEIDQQIAHARAYLGLVSGPKHMELHGLYYYGDWTHGKMRMFKTSYHGRIMADLEYAQSDIDQSDSDKYIYTRTFADIAKSIDSDYYSDRLTYPGLPIHYVSGTSGMTVLTADDMVRDIRIALSLPVMLTAFILKNKKWSLVKVSAIKEVDYQEIAFDKLVVDKDIKDFIYKVAMYQDQNYFEDLISGKAGGSIFLLSGPSAVGKSITAESIAEVLHRPLYQMQMR